MYLGLMGNIMFGVQVRKEVGERWRRNVVVCGMFSAAGVGFLIQLHGGVNANVDQNLFFPCIHRPISQQFSCRTMPLSHSRTGKAVP